MYFSLNEFQRASVRSLSDREEYLARVWEEILDPVRTAYGGPIRVTSFIRNTGSHATGQAVDIQPVFGLEPQIMAIADYVAAVYLPSGRVRQVIYEAPGPGQFRGHVHITTTIVGGATPGYLADYSGNEKYVTRKIPSVSSALATVQRSGNMLMVVAVAIGALFLLSRV